MTFLLSPLALQVNPVTDGEGVSPTPRLRGPDWAHSARFSHRSLLPPSARLFYDSMKSPKQHLQPPVICFLLSLLRHAAPPHLLWSCFELEPLRRVAPNITAKDG